jgi:hypothetical protein
MIMDKLIERFKSKLSKPNLEINAEGLLLNPMTRLDILYGFVYNPPIFSCEKCYSEKCEGTGKCEGYGAYQLCVKVGD